MSATCSCKVSPAPSHPPRTNRPGQFVPSSSRPRPSSYLHRTIWHHRNQRTDVPRARGSDDRQNEAETRKGQTVIPEDKGTWDNRDHSQPKVSVSSAPLTLPAHPGTGNRSSVCLELGWAGSGCAAEFREAPAGCVPAAPATITHGAKVSTNAPAHVQLHQSAAGHRCLSSPRKPKKPGQLVCAQAGKEGRTWR